LSDDKLIKTDDPNLLKYSDTGALVSTDVPAFKKFKLKEEQSKKIKNQENDLNNIKSEVSELKNEMSEIKDLLYQLLNK
jgi:predicted transcriptional regulator